jgi:hypothetical protein
MTMLTIEINIPAVVNGPEPTSSRYLRCCGAARQSGSLSVVKSRVLGSVSSGSVVLYEVRDYPAS